MVRRGSLNIAFCYISKRILSEIPKRILKHFSYRKLKNTKTQLCQDFGIFDKGKLEFNYKDKI
jgi:hypothetical protein